jgi:predicted transcriptional regulator
MATNGTVTGKIVDWNLPLKQLKLIDMSGSLNEDLPITSGTTVWGIDKFKTVNDTNSLMDINEFLENRADDVIVEPNKNFIGTVVTEDFMNNF